MTLTSVRFTLDLAGGGRTPPGDDCHRGARRRSPLPRAGRLFGQGQEGRGMEALKPVIPHPGAFKDEADYDRWKAHLEEKKRRDDERSIELLRGIPTIRYEGVEAKTWHGGLLYGPAGVGKTREAIARLLSTPRGIFYSCAEFIEDARAEEMDEADELQERRLGAARTVAHLVLDDLGARRPTVFAQDRVLALVDYRWSRALETLVTSNLTPREIGEAWGERVLSRVLAFGVVERLTGSDRRRP